MDDANAKIAGQNLRKCLKDAMCALKEVAQKLDIAADAGEWNAVFDAAGAIEGKARAIMRAAFEGCNRNPSKEEVDV